MKKLKVHITAFLGLSNQTIETGQNNRKPIKNSPNNSTLTNVTSFMFATIEGFIAQN